MMRLRCALVLAILAPSVAVAANQVVVHRDPGCGCCEKWAALVKRSLGRPVAIVDSPRRATFDDTLGVPRDLRSCHTAVVDGLAFEGHVPIADMQRLLATRPKGITGLAVADMPMGSLGMEMPGMKGDAYDVIAFGPGQRRVFAHHG